LHLQIARRARPEASESCGIAPDILTTLAKSATIDALK
jgi:hypothetical protein